MVTFVVHTPLWDWDSGYVVYGDCAHTGRRIVRLCYDTSALRQACAEYWPWTKVHKELLVPWTTLEQVMAARMRAVQHGVHVPRPDLVSRQPLP